MIAACPLCAAPAPEPFLLRHDVPVHQNLTAATAADARAMPRGRLAMAACGECGFVFNRAFDPALLLYGPGYDNTQSLSPAFSAHLDGLAQHLVEACGVRGARIVEVGCGQGHFLRKLVAWPGAGNSGVGFDPAYQGEAVACGGALRFVRGLYGPDATGTPADVVICRHVIEHVSDPLALLRAVRSALRHAPAARVFFETPDVSWIFRNRVVWDFFYEHCSLFSARSLVDAFCRSGFHVRGVRYVFAGQYLWLEATLGGWRGMSAPGNVAAQAEAFTTTEATRVAAWRERLAGLAARGPVAVWGAGAKGATFAGLADPECAALDCLVDINPAKQGRFVPGTGHPIVAPASLPARRVRQVVPINPAYRAEIAAVLPGGARLAEWAN